MVPQAKKMMLQEWLVVLVNRAKKSPRLQRHINLFLDVAGNFDKADSKLLLNANNVTKSLLQQLQIEQFNRIILPFHRFSSAHRSEN